MEKEHERSMSSLQEEQRVWVSIGRVWRIGTVTKIYNMSSVGVKFQDSQYVETYSFSDVKPCVDNKRPRMYAISYKGK